MAKHFLIIIAAVAVGLVAFAAVSALALDITSVEGYAGLYRDAIGTPPAGDTLALGTAQGTVVVKNFYAANPPVVDGDTVIVKQTDNYIVTYDLATSEFWLAILGRPFATYQAAAEQDFLATLGVSQADACKLEVASGILYTEGDPLDGYSFPLSFCSTSGGR